MPQLEPPDNHFLDAATGWLMLGNAKEAWLEFKQIRPEASAHPDVLDFEWRWFAHEKRWQEAVEVGERLVTHWPDRADAWIHRSYALHELRRTQEAFEQLLPAVKRFPKETTIPYNLACYTSQLGDLPAARHWFAQVLALGHQPAEKVHRLKSALTDFDLQPLWPELRQHLESLETASNP